MPSTRPGTHPYPAPPPPPPVSAPGPPPGQQPGGPDAGRRERREAWYRPPVAGQLTLGWRIVTAIVWGLVFVGLIAVWKTSRELGLNTWWLGPIGEPASPIFSMVPFIAPVAMILLAVNNLKWLPWFGLGASALTAVVAAFDVSKVPRLALVEFAIAGAGALAAIGALSGRYRNVTPPEEHISTADSGHF